MPIKITVKKPPPSNETQTLVEKGSGKAANPPPAVSPEPASLIPFIDRISVVLDVADGDDASAIHSGIWTQLNDTAVFKTGKKWGPYQVGRRVVIDSLVNAKKWPLLQYGWADHKGVHKAAKFRTEFSPVDLGPDGLTEFHAQLISIMPDGWAYFVAHGRVTMIEVTVDLPNVPVDQFHLMPQQGPSAMAWKASGQLETLVLGKSGSNQTRVYDRGKKRIALGQKWTGPPTTRVERRLRFQQPIPLAKLGLLPNPFSAMTMIVTQTAPPPDEVKAPYVWTLFLDSVSVRGLSTALKLLPAGKRTMYRKWLMQHPTSWWDPHAIWSKWPGVLKDLKLLKSKNQY